MFCPKLRDDQNATLTQMKFWWRNLKAPNRDVATTIWFGRMSQVVTLATCNQLQNANEKFDDGRKMHSGSLESSHS